VPSLEFKGKSFVYTHHLSVPYRELLVVPEKSCPVEGKQPDLDDNLILHGDNLEALKALLPRYAGRVDCIYIDPPYNTGTEGWCYNDAVNAPLMRDWLKKAANPVERDDLQRHDKWLCMMWPRLQLLKELLAEDGAIFVSIDDNEVGDLLQMMDEVFGEERRIAVFTWIRKKKGSNLSDEFRKVTEYVLAYKKSDASIELHGAAAYAEKAVPLLNRSNNTSTLTFPAKAIRVGRRFGEGKVRSGKKGPPGELGVELLDDIDVKDGLIQKAFRLRGRFRWSQAFLDAEFKGGSEFVLSVDFRVNVFRHNQENRSKAPASLLGLDDGIGTNEDASEELTRIFSDLEKMPFDYPKPVSLVQFLLRAKTHKQTDALILDSFAGSGTTGHAVIALNEADAGTRQFVLVQCDEYDKEKREAVDVCDTLTAERMRRVIRGYDYTGTQETELHPAEKVTWTTFAKDKNRNEILERIEGIKVLEGGNYDQIETKIEGGVLTVVGKKTVEQKMPGLGGSFTYLELGEAMDLECLLAETPGTLPSFPALARYLFFTATGHTLPATEPAVAPKPAAKMKGKAKTKLAPESVPSDAPVLIGETAVWRIYLHYRPDEAWLRSPAAAFTRTQAEAIAAASMDTGKQALVFAAAKFINHRSLRELRVDFAQLPYALHRVQAE
jgi:adenine-specific DNA-methyltransferase